MSVEFEQLGAFGLLGDEPPTEIKLFGFGTTATRKGSFVLDAAGAASVMEAFFDGGMDRLPFDAGHGQLAGSGAHPAAHKSKGWFLPEVRVDGLYASDIQWTKSTKAELSDREWRFFSPAIRFDGASRRILELINVALTNQPATKNQRPLVLSATPEKADEMKPILEKLGAADETGALAAIAGLESQLSMATAELSAVTGERDSLKTQLATLTAAAVKEKRDAAITKLIEDGKLAPAQKPFAESLSMEQLGQFAETLTAIRPVSIESGTEIATLSSEELDVCAKLGIKPEDFLNTKATAKKGGR